MSYVYKHVLYGGQCPAPKKWRYPQAEECMDTPSITAVNIIHRSDSRVRNPYGYESNLVRPFQLTGVNDIPKRPNAFA